jgi:N-acyl-L-homoserine lactone synthetase
VLVFRQATSVEDLEKIYRLRYEVYCLEKKFLSAENYPDGLESDEYDQHSIHFIAEETSVNRVVGVVRLVLNSSLGFPIEKHFNLTRPIKSPANTVEISRLIVHKEFRYQSVYILMGFSKEIYLYSRSNSIDDCFAVIEDPLLRLFMRMGLPFIAVGDRNWYFNSTNLPVMLSIAATEEVLLNNNALFYEYIMAPRSLVLEV